MAQRPLRLEPKEMKFEGKPYKVALPAADIYTRLANLGELKERMGSLPDDLKAKMGTVNFPDENTLAFTAPGVGEMKFKIVERIAPSRVRFLADTGVVPINVMLDLTEIDSQNTNVKATIETEIPAMLRPMVGSKLQEAADKFGEMFGQLNA